MAGDVILENRRSPEYTIDLTVEGLLAKMLAGALTPAEMAEYNQLLAQRSRLMRHAIHARHRRKAA